MFIKQRAQAGFTLLEVMVATAIFAVGMLGVAGLHLIALENNHAAYLRTQAVNITQDIVERMRNNPKGVAAKKFDALKINSDTRTAVSNLCTGTASCNASQLADADIMQWAKLIRTINTDNSFRKLPEANATVTRGSGNKINVFTFVVTWETKKWRREIKEKKDIYKRTKQTNVYAFRTAIK